MAETEPGTPPRRARIGNTGEEGRRQPAKCLSHHPRGEELPVDHLAARPRGRHALLTFRSVWFARARPVLIASSKLEVEVALISVTRATDMPASFVVVGSMGSLLHAGAGREPHVTLTTRLRAGTLGRHRLT